MKFQVNPSLAWGAVFSVPAVIVDRYIKLASPEQLKTLLWVLRHAFEQPTIESISEELGFSVADVKEYLSFWVYEGILVSEDTDIPKAVEKIQHEPKVESIKKELPDHLLLQV